jgi:hypothetical protein
MCFERQKRLILIQKRNQPQRKKLLLKRKHNMKRIYYIFLLIGIILSVSIFPKDTLAEDIRCYSYGCVIPHEDKLFLPIWDL